MAERRTIGQILMSFGRITEEDVERAIEYQREEGGYFGEALLAIFNLEPSKNSKRRLWSHRSGRSPT